ncbi:MAG: thymidine kinase [Candidatus Babeliaceae bacterium]|jgi:thymidine kinase
MHKKNRVGKLEVVCGSMFSGKSEELIRRVRRAEFAHLSTQVFKHCLDNRKTVDHINAHSGDKLAAIAIDSVVTLQSYVLDATEVIGIDEVQFFSNDIIPVIQQFVAQGKRVIVAGLDLDFRGTPFGCMPALLALADSATKLQAVCMTCGNDAHFTQRLVNGSPARSSDPVIVIGAEECYQARCRECYQIDVV